MQTLITIYHLVQRVISISLNASRRTDSHIDYSADLKILQFCGQRDYIGLDNVKMYRYENFDQNITCDSKVMSNCQTYPRQTFVTVLHTSVLTMLKCISMQNLIKIYGQFKSYEHFH